MPEPIQQGTTPAPGLSTLLPQSIRTKIENRYYARVNDNARLDVVRSDPAFWAFEDHPAWFSDHGIVHVRDVASQILHVIDTGAGTLFPDRDRVRLDGFMKAYGALLAYIHDIGMSDFSIIGRRMHAEFAAQEVFSPAFDEIVSELWEEGCGGLSDRIRSLHTAGHLKGPPERVLREMMALALGHSKSKIPIGVLTNPSALRSTLLLAAGTELPALYAHQIHHRAGPPPGYCEQRMAILQRYYRDFHNEAFTWLTQDTPAMQPFLADVIDTVRALRCADALRMRGTVQKTSGGHEVFISARTGLPIYSLREKDSRIFLVERDVLIPSGEANIASTELTPEGALLICFHRGSFETARALERAVQGAAIVAMDIIADIFQAFSNYPPGGGFPDPEIHIQFELTPDNPSFSERVIQAILEQSPAPVTRIQTVPPFHPAAKSDGERYLHAGPVDLSPEQTSKILEQMGRSGTRVDAIDPAKAFGSVRIDHLETEDVLIEANTGANLVYIPLDHGLEIRPLGGYERVPAPPLVPVGSSGVIRGGVRNANVVAVAPVTVLLIPKDVYLREWFHPYSLEELRVLLADQNTDQSV